MRFCIKISSFKTSILKFLRKTKFSNLPLETYHKRASPCKDFRARAKRPSSGSFPSTPCRDGLLTGVRRCLGMSPKLATAQLPTVLQRCFQRWRLKTTSQVSPVQFNCTKKLLMKSEVNQCYHTFQEDFVI